MEDNNYSVPQASVYPTVEKHPPITLVDWMLTLLILAIPIVNFIMLLVWAFSSDTNPSKSNFAKAALLWMVVGIVLSLIFMTTIIGALSTFSNSFNV